MTKEEKIKEAYGIHWETSRRYIDFSNGTISNRDRNFDIHDSFFEIVKINTENKIRPKSLQGIENNNGWIKIESEDDLPKNSGDFWIINAYGSLIKASFLVNIKAFFKFGDIKATHYQLIIKPQPPIY